MQVREYTTQGATFRMYDAYTLGVEIDTFKMTDAAVAIEGPMANVVRDLFNVAMTAVVYTVDITFADDADLTDATRNIREVWTSEAFKARDFKAMWLTLRGLFSDARDLWFEAWRQTRPMRPAPVELTPEAEALAKTGADDPDFLADGKPKAAGTSKRSKSTPKR